MFCVCVVAIIKIVLYNLPTTQKGTQRKRKKSKKCDIDFNTFFPFVQKNSGVRMQYCYLFCDDYEQ